MGLRANDLAKRILQLTPIDVRRRLPSTTFSTLNLLLSHLELSGKRITVVQIGACDGIYNDPLRHFIVRGDVRAILVEPNPSAFERLQNVYRCSRNVTLLNVALAEYDGTASLYRLKRSDISASGSDRYDTALQIASFNPKHLQKHGKRPSDIEEIKVPCRSLVSLLEELGIAKLDLLQIDAEGFDATVVRMALALSSLPDCINFEHRHLRNVDRNPLYELLAAKGYLLSYDDWDLLAVQSYMAADWS